MNFPKYYIGPMSKNVVDCVMEHGQQHFVGLIPSRRQVDFNCGYVNNWNTKTFSEYVYNKVLLCRDHGGESQGTYSDDGKDSFENDCKYFDLIHVDPFRASKNIEDAALKTIEYIKFCFSKNQKILYEVGTEEAIFKYQPEELKVFLDILKRELSEEEFFNIKYAVVQSGTRLHLPTRTNIGNFDIDRLKRFVDVVKDFDLMSKEHNGDYLIDSCDVGIRFSSGLDAINIAPEFGQIESEYYLERCKKDKILIEELYQLCYNSNKWKKWIPDISRVSKQQLIITCCHYIFSDAEFLSKVKSNFPRSDIYIRKRINSKLKFLHEQTKGNCI